MNPINNIGGVGGVNSTNSTSATSQIAPTTSTNSTSVRSTRVGGASFDESFQFPPQLEKEIAFKYQSTLFKLITTALKGYGLYHNDNSRLSSFLALIFFRVPLFRKYFFDVI